MNQTILAIVVSVILIAGAVMVTSGGSGDVSSVNNVTIANGKQIVEISAKGGYLPRRSTAKAGIPTVLKVNTNGTFDCSIAVRIPSMKISRNLQPSGTEEIDLGSPKEGILQGTCAMGMYPFEIDFKS